MGGLWRKLPVTGTTFFIGVLAIAGLPFLSGFYSKDAILSGAYVRFPVLFWMGLGAAVLTAFYMMRLFAMTFLGNPRDQHIHDHAHEGGISMTLPLVVLGFLSVVAGWGFWGWHQKLLGPDSEHVILGARTILDLHAEHNATVVPLAIIAGLGGLAAGWFVFTRLASRVPALKRPFRPLEVAFHNKFWFDELFRELILKPGYAIARFCTLLDRVGVDGAVNGIGRGGVRTGDRSALTDNVVVDGLVRLMGAICQAGGAVVSTLQSGRIRFYLSMSVGVVALTLVLRWIL